MSNLNTTFKASDVLTSEFGLSQNFDEKKEFILENLLGHKNVTEASYMQMFQRFLGLAHRYHVARLCIGYSLSKESIPLIDKKNIESSSRSKISGHILFGHDDYLLWVGIITQHYYKYSDKKTESLSLDIFKKLVHAHWDRGMDYLIHLFEKNNRDLYDFINELVKNINFDNKNLFKIDIDSSQHIVTGENTIRLQLGKIVENAQNFEIIANDGQGHSPHIAIMGQAGTGKTRSMLDIIQQIKFQKPNIPVLFLDLGKTDTTLNQTLQFKSVDVTKQPVPLDMFENSINDTSNTILGFRDSLERVIKRSSTGAIQSDHLREAIRELFSTQKQITLENILESVKNYYQENSLKDDSIISTLNDLTEWELFKPEQSPNEFFNQDWLITFGQAHDTPKKLTAFLMLDALNYWLKQQSEAPIDSQGHRQIKMVLVIDEARQILQHKHPALSEIIRLHRSKGLLVILASQTPDDYKGEDDYVSNMGAFICLNTTASNLSALKGIFMNQKVDLASLTKGQAIVRDSKKNILKVKLFD